MIPANNNCLVIGATNPTSIGFCVAWTLLKEGAGHVTIMGRDQSKLDDAVELLQRQVDETLGGSGSSNTDGHNTNDNNNNNNDTNNDNNSTTTKPRVSGVLGDLKRPETMTAVALDAIEKRMGGRLDVLVCCGGNGYSEYLGLSADDLDSYRIMQDVAVLSPMVLARAAVPYLSKSQNRHGGTVVMVGSVSATVPWPSTAPHNVAMAAKNTMTQTLAFQHRGDNVRVNGVQAGVIHTGALDVMAAKKHQSVESYAALRATAQPLGRNGTPEDVANAVLYLASPSSGFTTGELLRVDGGLHLSNWWNQQAMLNQK